MTFSCACIGECMIELRPRPDGAYDRSFAGDAYNAAVYLKRSLGAAGDVAFVTALGDDPMSVDMRTAFATSGVSDRLAFTVQGGAPGLYMIELDAKGERTFVYWRGASAARGWLRELERAGGAKALAGLDLVYLSGISLAILTPEDRRAAIALMEALRGTVGLLAFDPNVRPRLWETLAVAAAAIECAAECADIVLPSSQDGLLLWNEADPAKQLRRWRGLGASEVALTLEAEGAVVSGSEGEAKVAPVRAERVVDTSGAGDSFNGAYLAARLQGAACAEAAAKGLALGARVVGFPGAIAPA